MLLAVSCDKERTGSEDATEVEFEVDVRSQLKTYVGAEVTFKCTSGKGPLATDRLLFKSGSSSVECKILKASDTEFTFVVAEGIKTASYFVWIERGEVSKKIGVVSVTIVDPDEIPDVDYNLYGKVTANGLPISGVVVSDGYLTTQTGTDGMYYLQSEKERGYVFISIPSGYEAKSSGVFPRFYSNISKAQYEVKEVNFTLTPVSGQDNHIMYVLGDLHLAARNDDLKQFRMFADDLNDRITANAARPQYVMTLGDMTWDIFWDDFALSDYVTEMNAQFKGVNVFNTVGNHDHDVDYAGDFYTVQEYFTNLGPNYYSFNIGKVHYVVLDDIYCKNTGDGTSDSRKYAEEVDAEQLQWLKADLSYVDKSMTVVVAAHAPVYTHSTATSFTGALNNSTELIDCFNGFHEVHFFTGHTHDIYNVDKLGASVPHFEHNAGAVCATWWWTYKTCGMNLARDGAPGGYTVCDFDGNDFEWLFKAYDREDDYQFRAYDMNKVDSSEFPAGYQTYTGVAANSVLINIWNWDPEWSLSVKENGAELSWTQIRDYDPLHVLGYTKVRGTGTTSSFLTKKTPHLFMVQAKTAEATLEIAVTDRFGNVYEETMTRPREFSVANYK